MKIIQCVLCDRKTSSFIQTWKEFLNATKGWKKYYCIGKQQHDLNICPKCGQCGIEFCPICHEQILDELEWNQLRAEQGEWDNRNRF